jgi:hypothetical protein
MTFQTSKNDPNNRSDEGHSELQNELRSLWLGRQFWNQTFSDDFEVIVEEIRQLLDQVEDCGEAGRVSQN